MRNLLRHFRKNNQEKPSSVLPEDLDSVVTNIKNLVEDEPVVEFKGAISKAPLIIPVCKKVRFVRLSLQTLSCFHLDTIEILDKDGQNISRGKKTIVSSTYNNEEKYDGRGVLVGKKDGGCGFHTKRENHPWLIIDLESIISVNEVVIYNREGTFGNRAHSLKVDGSSNLYDWQELYDNWKVLNRFLERKPSELQIAIIRAYVLDPVPAKQFLKKLISEGKEDDAIRFQACISQIVKTKGYGFGPHGFTRTFELRPDAEKRLIAEELSKVLTWLNNEFGVPTFISSGTLLGMVRDGRFIDHDDDIDICYISNAQGDSDIIQERKALVQFLQSKGCVMTPSDVAHYWCKTPGGQSLDIFTGFVEGEMCSMNPISRNSIDVKSVLPVVPFEYCGAKLYMPANSEKILEANYGKGWRNPDPLWSFDWSRAKKEFGFLYF